MAKKATAPIDPQYGHLQPQAPDVEKLVLGELMIDKDAFSMVSDILKEESFYEPRHQKIFAAIRNLCLKDNPVDIITVTEQLNSEGTLDEVGGPTYVLELSSRVVSSAHVTYHANILAHKSLARQLIQYASNIERKAFDATVDVNELMQEAEGSLFEISQKNLKKDYTVIGPVVKQAYELLQKASQNTSGMTGVPSGFKQLDELTSGWQKSDLIIIAGRPAMGKTSFALSIAKNVAVDYNIPVAFFSLDMNSVQLVNRLLSNTCYIEGKKIQNGQLTRDDWERFDKNLMKLQEAPIYLDDTAGMSIFELSTKARRMVRENNIQLLMIDYLQLMNASGSRFSNRQEEVSTISRSLKILAKDLNIPIIALSQLNRGVDTRQGPEGKRPQLSDLRESGAIEQDADMVLFVHRPEYYGIKVDDKGNPMIGMGQILVAKHRKGAIGDITLKFSSNFTRFENPDEGAYTGGGFSGGSVIESRINDDAPFDYPPADAYDVFDN